ncbi:uncharacterized protein LOC119192539 isoform X2 [Manduca sexta]|uniref:uncharacterized protein LOC119192539 isoform X2 n=1 Tax=Manduca sexta TaxID=7130 RepID=UPI00188DEE73|nr:uncharacterized protein LOC119192539 isoform X2 [Manduca sexta]
MRVEIPDCNRCFMCIPLRYGIIIIGCSNLVLDLWVLSLQSSWLMHRGNQSFALMSSTLITYKGVTFNAQIWLPMLLYVLEVIFNVVVVIGALCHIKCMKLLRIYYYYGITTLLATFVTFLVVELRILFRYYNILEICITFMGLASHAYLLLLVRSEMSKTRYKEESRSHEYENHLTQHYPPNWREPNVI